METLPWGGTQCVRNADQGAGGRSGRQLGGQSPEALQGSHPAELSRRVEGPPRRDVTRSVFLKYRFRHQE